MPGAMPQKKKDFIFVTMGLVEIGVSALHPVGEGSPIVLENSYDPKNIKTT